MKGLNRGVGVLEVLFGDYARYPGLKVLDSSILLLEFVLLLTIYIEGSLVVS